MRPLAALLLAAAGILGACVKPEVEPMFQPAFEPFDPTDPAWRVTRPLLLISDCQVFNVDSKPVADRNLSAQSMVPTAIRSPQLNLFTPEVLRWILADDEVEAEGIIHLGDALDLACEGEFRTFLEVMSTTELPWLMAPGNHDSFYFGNFDPIRRHQWRDACFGAGEPLSKDRFVRFYVAALLRQAQPFARLLAESLGISGAPGLPLEELAARVPDHHEWRAPADSGAFLARIEWNVDRDQPWRSYVMQEADLEGGSGEARAYGLILDSCQYELRPVMLPNAWRSYPLALNAGLAGQLLPDQLRSLRTWLDEAEADGRAGLLMSHHPLASYEAKARASLQWLLTRHPRLGIAITAHTHAGHYEHHAIGDDHELVELNVGSTTDWPMEWRTFQAFYDPERALGSNLYLHSRRFTLAERLRNRPGYFQEGWEVPFGELGDYRFFRMGVASTASITDMYLGYHLRPFFLGPANVTPRKGAYETEARYKDTLLHTFGRLVREFPTDVGEGALPWPAGCSSDEEVLARITECSGPAQPIDAKIALAQELEAFERARHTRDPQTGQATDEERLKFKLSQAVWASRYGYTRGRTLQPEDELVRVRTPELAAPPAGGP